MVNLIIEETQPPALPPNREEIVSAKYPLKNLVGARNRKRAKAVALQTCLETYSSGS